jgi:hypothetical protein
MTQTDFTALSRPQTAAAASKNTGGTRRRAVRGLLALPVALAFLGPVAPALAASSTSGYGTAPPVTKPSPANGTGPSTSSSPAKTVPTVPAGAAAPRSTAAAPSSSSTLPFTGLDLRWIVGGGVLLIAGGLTIRMMQRKEGNGFGR